MIFGVAGVGGVELVLFAISRPLLSTYLDPGTATDGINVAKALLVHRLRHKSILNSHETKQNAAIKNPAADVNRGIHELRGRRDGEREAKGKPTRECRNPFSSRLSSPDLEFNRSYTPIL